MRRLTILATLLATLVLGLTTAGSASAQGGGLPPNFYGVIPIQLMQFSEFQRMNAVYREYFPTDPPARATVGVTRLASTYRVEMDVTAAR